MQTNPVERDQSIDDTIAQLSAYLATGLIVSCRPMQIGVHITKNKGEEK
jgi:hypothetical protein